LAASSVFLSASAVEISGFGAPALTAMPTPELASVVSVPARSCQACSKRRCGAAEDHHVRGVAVLDALDQHRCGAPSDGELVAAGLVKLRKQLFAALRTPMVLKTTSSAMRGGILLAYRYTVWE